jgi:anti-sigma28 factor (negative regulator of flagellin synthesis)
MKSRLPLYLLPSDAATGPSSLRVAVPLLGASRADVLVARDLYTIVDGGLDRARIAALRQAVECGRYLANCARIADGLIATVCCRWSH